MTKKSQTTENFLTIPKTNFGKAVLTIEGTAPLVTNPFPVKAMMQIKEKQNTAKKDQPKKKEHAQRFPYEDFGNSMYWITPKPKIKTEGDWQKALLDNPRFGFHVGGIRESALSAAQRLGQIKNMKLGRTYFRIENVHTDTLYGTPVVEILTESPPIMREDCLSTYNSGADMRYRAMFEKWKMELEVVYLADFINIETIAHWLQLGGFSCGLGENRAEVGGSWGSYCVT